MRALSRARWPWIVLVALLAGALVVAAIGDTGSRTTAERARSVAESIKCPTCQGQSVADSSAPAARSIRTEIARRLESGETDDEIRDYIAGIYGEEALLTPPRDGVAGLIWFLPVAGLVAAIGGLAVVFRRWRVPEDIDVSNEDRVLVERARRACSTPGFVVAVSDAVRGRGRRLDPDALAALEEERDFLLRSLDDLERERAAGDVDDHDYRTLVDDYTARAAAVLRAIDAGRTATASPSSGRSRGRRLATLAGVALVAVLAGVLVAQASGRRGSGGLTGLDVTAASSRIDDCQALEQEGDADGALDCYSEVLESLPANVEALTFRGWLQVREFDLDDGLDDLGAAIQLAPESTAPYIFRASGRARDGDAPGAVGDLAAFYENDPAEEEVALADQFAGTIVDQALDRCIAGDVQGSLPAEDVLRCYRDVLVVDEGNATANVYLGWLLARSGLDDDAAMARLDDGLAADPDLTAGYVFRAALRAHLGDTEGALADLATFDEVDAPADQQAAADQIRSAIEAGDDPL